MAFLFCGCMDVCWECSCDAHEKRQRACDPLSSLSQAMASGNGPWRSSLSFCCHLPHRSKDLTLGSQPLSVFLSLNQVQNTVLKTYNLFARFRLHEYLLNCTQAELVFCFVLFWFQHVSWTHFTGKKKKKGTWQVLCICGNLKKKRWQESRMIITEDWEGPLGWGEVKGRVDQDMHEWKYHTESLSHTTYWVT